MYGWQPAGFAYSAGRLPPGLRTMPTENLTYAELAERLSISPEAARGFARRLRLPRAPGNDGRARITVDLAEIQHRPATTRPKPAADPLADALAKIAALEAELATAEARAAGCRADFEHERERNVLLVG